MMKRVLIIRSLEEAESMIRPLTMKGIEVSHHPLFIPHFLPIPSLHPLQAIIITSKNAIRAMERYEEYKENLLYVVGDETARLAHEKGFKKILSAHGKSQDLLSLVINKAQKSGDMLWHLSGEHIKKNMVEELKRTGFMAKRHIVYSLTDVEDLPHALCDEIKTQSISHVIFCSTRTTNVFISLLKKQKLEKKALQITALCLSPGIKQTATSLPWKNIWVSSHPNIQALMGYFNEKR